MDDRSRHGVEDFLRMIDAKLDEHHKHLRSIDEKMDDSLRRTRALKRRLEHIMAAIDDLTAQVAKNTDTIESAIVLIGNIKALLDAAGTDPAKLAELSATLGAEDDKLAAAVVANTPAATP